MRRIAILAAFALLPLAGQDGDLVFRSDVTLVRVDVQVLDRAGQRITSLTQDDFRLRVNGQPAELRGFGQEQVPLDLLLLIDVSGSMRPHVERIAMGVRSALRALGPEDRVAIMVFDRRTRLRLGLESDHDRVARGLEDVLDSENFNSGTAITRALKDAARWLGQEARTDARRAIVILTDDETADGRDEEGVLAALDRSQAALSVLLAPASERRNRGVNWPRRRGGIIIGMPRFPIPGAGTDMLASAGVREIARETGGDTFRVEDSEALQMTFERLRQRYALFYSDATGAAPVDVVLSDAARRRYPGAEVAFRRPGNRWGEPRPEAPPVISRTPAPAEPPPPVPEERKGGWRSATPDDMKPETPDKPAIRRRP